jgi:hypothetical protein
LIVSALSFAIINGEGMPPMYLIFSLFIHLISTTKLIYLFFATALELNIEIILKMRNDAKKESGHN